MKIDMQTIEKLLEMDQIPDSLNDHEVKVTFILIKN
jgi:hypothetical protein